MTDDLASWLLARLDEEQAEIERMRDAVWPEFVAVVPSADPGPPDEGEPMGSVSVAPQYTKMYGRVWNPAQASGLNFDNGWRLHESAIVVWSPDVAQRRLAEVEAKRRIVKLHNPAAWSDRSTADEFGRSNCPACREDTYHPGHPYRPAPYPCDTLLALTQPYADRKDFRQEWKLLDRS